MIERLNKDPFALHDATEGSGRRWLPWALVVLLVALLAGAWYLWQSMSEPKSRQTVSSAPKPGLQPPPAGGSSAAGGGGTSGAGGPAGGASGGASAPGTPGTGPLASGPGGPGLAAGGTNAPMGGVPDGSVAPGWAGSMQPGTSTQAGGFGSDASAAASGGPGQAGVPGMPSAEGTIPLVTPRYPIERSLSGTGPIDPGTATLDPPAADKAISNALSAIPGREQILRFTLPSEVVRRVVLTIDNLPGDTMSMQYRAVNATGGPIRIERQGQAIVIAAANAGRYDEFVRMATNIDTRRLLGLYKRFYPLFQQEYTSIGYPDRHFNDRVVEVIDDMLATPVTAGPIELIQPRVLYEYADPALERRSVGQRILLRMGPEHSQKLKAKLREIRTALTNETR